MDILKQDIANVEDGINKNYEGPQLTQQQLDALVSLGINSGRGRLLNSQLFADVQAGVTDQTKILNDFTQHSYSKNKYIEGLAKRRNDEAEIFFYGDYNRNDDLSLDNPQTQVK